MNTSVSVPGAFAPVKKKSSFFSKLNLLRLVRAVIPAAVLMMFFPQMALAAGGQDLMQSGNDTVKATFGKDSSIVKWVVLAEVLVGAVMYMMTKNVKFLAGFAIISVFIAVGMTVVGL
ncbi:type IV conjugative transfer system pilin TraA [Escherichia coli]|uniref:type IV conjugative transfer system pilin TraA n=2 Tax=Escherichia coli TaxID=562 RepID=UPI00038F91E4|nr:type IV conjugative transfer system pilin TraA [Escherichia coli]EER0916366.1 type IV conjugative transfer system pilin TraA [Escherichia coli O168:H8]EES8553616.1 type IV conjugative transfer system pilin TraA [Escherichia coli O168]EEY4453712.1 type IV conjugative transfer system pilin TraA [Escherichia coli O130]EFA7778113.1 type IV conjugative transfer system pilin TraA [Escherichia coli O157:H7]EFW8125046.1 type IV conjugative transfer system pilin TraA [Shigella sonnei]EHW0745781.1 t